MSYLNVRSAGQLPNQPHLVRAVDVHVGSRIRCRREAIGMAMEQLAAAIGAEPEQVRLYECGAVRPEATQLFKIACTLESSISFFFGDA